MCGRYATSRTPGQLEIDFFAHLEGAAGQITANYNVAPTHVAPIVRLDAAGQRVITLARWGLVPAWAKDRSIGNRLINARSETVADKPAFRSAFARRRAVVPADGYFEWYVPEQGPKVPFYIHRPGGVGLAGLYEIWRDPAAGAATEPLVSFTILTTSATGEDGRLHDRAPLLVEPESMDEWLTASSGADVLRRLTPATPGRLQAWPVSRAVNSVANNSADLLEPLATE